MPRVPRVRNHQAFTLLEVMVAVSILAIALVALFGSQSRSLANATQAQFNIVAPMLASTKLAEIQASTTEPSNDDGDFGEAYPGYRWKVETETAQLASPEALATLEQPLQRVDVTVSWSDTNFSYALRYYGRWQQ